MSRYIIRFLSTIFNWMYSRGAWAYDLIARVVSAGLWYQWVTDTLQFIDGGRRLEIGFGTGHLMTELNVMSGVTIGLERSSQMIKLTRKRYAKKHISIFHILRGTAYHMPFATQCFQSIIATFPAPYIFELSVQQEIHRLLSSDGKLIILFSANFNGTNWIDILYHRILTFLGLSPENFEQMQGIMGKLISPELFDAALVQHKTKRYSLNFLIAHPKLEQ
jgi:ubiquinone/menaquinone biosynthesis C-methylase UbiE